MGLGLSAPLVYLSILIIAVCGIVYELIIGAVSSFLWGDSIYYFSVTIGLYMSAMGLGAFLSKFLKQDLFDWFVGSEIFVGIFGGSSALFLFWAYANTEFYEYAFVAITVLIGMLVGLEIPLLIRILESQESLRKNVANVLSYDYIGGLIGALAFPVIFLPYLGLLKAAALLGISNLIVAGLNFLRHRRYLRHFSLLFLTTLLSALWLGYSFIFAPQLEFALEQRLYRDQVVFNQQTPYQKLTVTQWHNDIRLFINGGLQFSSLDEYRYHESLVHVPFAAVPHAQNILVLGGGDGLALREILKYPRVKQVTLVDIDPKMTDLFSQLPLLTQLNQNSLSSPKVKIIHQDAFKFVENSQQFFDIILVDLPDPSHTGLSKLYSQSFYEMVKRHLSLRGVMVTQSTSPFFAPEAFWCIHKTLQSAELKVYPYHVEIPSFGNWGFNLASQQKFSVKDLKLADTIKTRFLNPEMLASLFVFPEDLHFEEQQLKINTLIQPVILQYYNRGWNSIR